MKGHRKKTSQTPLLVGRGYPQNITFFTDVKVYYTGKPLMDYFGDRTRCKAPGKATVGVVLSMA